MPPAFECLSVLVGVCVYVCLYVQHVAYDYAKRVSIGMSTAQNMSAHLLSQATSV